MAITALNRSGTYRTVSNFLQFEKRGWRQTSPVDYGRVLPYQMFRVYIEDVLPGQPFGLGHGPFWSWTLPLYNGSTREQQIAYNSAYSRLMNKIRDGSERAEIGTGLVEIGSSARMVELRAMQLFRAARALRKGDVRSFLSELRVRELRKHRRKKWSSPKDFSALWLEYWMGWAPLVGDILTSVEVLTRKEFQGKLRVSRRFEAHRRSGSYQSYPDGQYTAQDFEMIYRGRVILGCEYSVSNPNLALANNLGLINPGLTAYQVIPFSWLLGWFVNVEQYLGAWTDLAGVTIKNSYTTRYAKGEGSSMNYGKNNTQGQWSHKYIREDVVMNRSLGISPPSLIWKLPERLSITRAATAISLLVGQLRG